MTSSSTKSAAIDIRLLQSMPGSSAILLPDSPRFTILVTTTDYLSLSGKTLQELSGKGLFEAFPNSPDDPQTTSENRLRASLERALKTKASDRLPVHRYDVVNANGVYEERYWTTVNKPVLDDEGNLLFIIHSVEEVTLKVKAEQREKAIQTIEKGYRDFMNAPILMCILTGEECTLVMANTKTLELWGKSAEIIGKPLFSVLPDLKRHGFKETIDEVRKTAKSKFTYETPSTISRNEKKETLYFNFIFQPYYENESDHHPTGVICVAHNVTEQVSIRHQFKQVVQQSPDPILILMGEELRLEVANQALFDLWQVSANAIGKSFLEILPEMKDQVFVQLLNEVMKTGEPFYGNEIPAVFKRKDSSEETRFLNFSYQPYRDVDGSIGGVLVMASDVTGQVVAKQKLQESEQNLRNTILQSPVAMCIVKGPSFVVEVANEGMLELWGKPKEVMLNKPVFDGIPEVREQGLEDLLKDVYNTGKRVTANERRLELLRKGKWETVYLNFVYEPFRGGDNSISGVIAVAMDVTEQVLARQKVEESVQEVRSLVESAPFPIGVYTGKEMRIRLVNQSIIDVWGKGPDVVDKTYAEVLPELKDTGIYKQLDDVYTTGIPFHARNQRVDLVVNGTLQPFYFNYSFTPLYNAEGNIYGVMNTAADVTDIVLAKQQVEQSERNFRSMILQAPVAMCILLGPEHIVDVANDAMIELWGKPKDAVVKRPIFDALPDARNQGLEKLMQDVFETGTPFYANEHPVELLRNGKWETVYQNFVYQPYQDADGEIIGVLAISINVTTQVLARQKIEELVVHRTRELAEANMALVRNNEELVRLNANLEDFAYAASHDMKEPIRKIHFFADRLKLQLQNQLTDEQKLSFQRLENASVRMGSLIDELLSYSQVSKGMAEREIVDLNRKVQLVLEDLELEVQQKGAQINVQRLPVIKGSKRQFQQLFQNLITNALKYCKPGTGPQVFISAKEVVGKEVKPDLPSEEANRKYYLVEVTDKGIGFSQKDADRIFNVFTRLHSNAEYKGTGVGLSIVKKVIENHGGYVWAKSQLGEGATFYILLPTE